jgi:hypothetical protein
MSADYPAAHSMDTEWFAVDRDGHVALFVSGENGPVPRAMDEGGMNLWDVLRSLTGKPSTEEEEAAYGGGLDREQALRLGMFIYKHIQYMENSTRRFARVDRRVPPSRCCR